MDELNVATTPQVTEGTTETQTTTQETQQTTDTTTQQTEQQTTPQAFKIKYLHEEKEVPYDEAPTYIQKGMDYDRVKGKYEETKPVLSFVEELAQESGMSVNDYLKAAREYKEAERIRALAEKEGISEELAQRLTKLERSETERQQTQQAYQQEQRKQQEYAEFFDYFSKENERSFDPNKDIIPDEVWQAVAMGKPLLDAYKANEATTLKAKLKEYESKLQIQKTNEANNATSTGSVTGNGATNTDFITHATFEANKHDQSWIHKNYKKILESRSKW